MNGVSNPEQGYFIAGDTWSIRQGALESCERVLLN
jgi:hypothetical protein